jgi:hypothetical protein
MIKVEYLPKAPKIKKYRATCKCGCVFTYDATDRINECFGHGDFWDVIFCPNCGNVIGTPWDGSKIEEI